MIRLAVRVHRAQADLVLAELLELAPSGVEEVAIGTEVVEYAVYGSPRPRPAGRSSTSTPRRSPTTGRSAGVPFTTRWCSATA
jgi:hypothetical protein